MSTPVSKMGIRKYKMANGLEVFTISKRDIPMVGILIAVRNGSFAETEKNNGLAHLYEHMFFKANEKIPSQPAFLRTLDELGVEMGSQMNAYTMTETVAYYMSLQSRFLKEGIQFMADAVMGPKFLQEELEKERQVVIGEFDRYEASPTEVFYQRSLMQRLFPQHFVRKNVIGTREVILQATREQMYEIQHRYYVPNNSALFIVGDFEEATLTQLLEDAFAKWQPGADPFKVYPVPEHPPLEKSVKFVDEAAVQNVSIVRAFHGPKLTKDEKSILALDLMSSMISFESSAFQKELVHSGLANSAAFFSWSQRYTSPLMFSVDANPETAQKAAEKLDELIQRLAQGNFFSERDLEIAKNSVEVSSAYDREVGMKFARALGNIWTMTGSLEFYETYVDKIKQIQLADIDQAVAEYLQDKPYIQGGLIPKGSKALPTTEAAAQ